LPAAVFALSLAAGSVALDGSQVWQALTGRMAADAGPAGAIVRELRLPRAAAALHAAACWRCPAR
jgi:iron complex transport system permease protein